MARRGENIRKRKDGRWEGRYIKGRDINGKAVYGSVYAKKYSIVKEKLKEIGTLEQGFLKGNKMLFREALVLWLESNSVKQKPQTYYKYLQLINTQIIPSIGHIMLSKINSVLINQFVSEKSASGKLNKKGGLSPSYIHTICFIIESTINYCVENSFCSPLSGKIIRPAMHRKELRILSFDEQKTLENNIFTNITETKMGIILSLYAGLRIGEVCGLKWKDIDLEQGIIYIKHTVQRIKNFDNQNDDTSKTVLILSDTKSESSTRIVPIPITLKKVLDKNKSKDNDFIIKGKKYPFADPRTLQYAFKKCLNECGLPNINYHALRHTFATRCVEAGVDVKTLSEILGHSNINITLNTYVHSSLEHKKEEIEKFDSYCGQ